MFTITPIVVSSFISMMLFLIVTVIAWRHRNGASGYYFAIMAACQTFWTAMVTLGYAAIPISLKVFFATLDAWGYMSANPFMLFFALSFTGYEHIAQKKWVKAVAAFSAISNILLVTTNSWHGLYWKNFIPQADNVILESA